MFQDLPSWKLDEDIEWLTDSECEDDRIATAADDGRRLCTDFDPMSASARARIARIQEARGRVTSFNLDAAGNLKPNPRPEVLIGGMEPGLRRKLRVHELSYEDPEDPADSDTPTSDGSEDDDDDASKPPATRKRGPGTPRKRATPAKKARGQGGQATA